MSTTTSAPFPSSRFGVPFRDSLRLLVCVAVFYTAPSAAGDPPGDVTEPTSVEGVKQLFVDPADDRTLRRTDADPSVDPLTGTWPELHYATLGRWAPAGPIPYADPYLGNFSTNGDYFRLDLVLDGLMNPPGPIAGYIPDLYGPNPLFGWVEIDMDDNADTGGDTEVPQIMYCANIARWGGMPQGPWFADRINTDGEPWSGTFGDLPATYRSGEEFFVIFQGDFINTIDYVDGNTDGVFEEDETWLVHGALFWRGPGYIPVTYAGGYEPDITIRFRHSSTAGTTTVTFVYPLTNQAYADLYDPMAVISYNFSSSDVNSIDEAMWDLELSADDPPFPGDSNMPLLQGWAAQDRNNHLDPWGWRCTFLFGTSLDWIAQGGEVFAWTDAWPNVVANDFNGDGLVTKTDGQILSDYIAAHDGEAGYDADGLSNGRIDRADFSDLFSMHDDDYDGMVSTDGFPQQGPCDYDNDGDVDLRDFRAMQVCYSTAPLDPGILANVGCLDAFDDNGDLDIDLADHAVFISQLSGP